ncbi:hypothetical protein [Chamaesiphon polymorphus]|uniref:Uncharacterized protein n=1 Tax=Chamaesiphon polymorphus CCALA 037 TaxID=2107692 RepID=A0A2T1GC32_9CYAN|nr:hypothetical protein [Chamaesiphon polymorphus]PSB54923.1 hypothetical protein C7B77_16665 [Chamaesiphon polymorphus CCALA 037]
MFNYLSLKTRNIALLSLGSAIATASLLSIATFHPAIAQNSSPTTAISETTLDLGSHSQFEVGTTAGVTGSANFGRFPQGIVKFLPGENQPFKITQVTSLPPGVTEGRLSATIDGTRAINSGKVTFRVISPIAPGNYNRTFTMFANNNPIHKFIVKVRIPQPNCNNNNGTCPL